jgi:sugar phosphate permease
MNKANRLFYGWWIVIVIAAMSFASSAAPFAIVLKQLMEQFHTGRGEVSLGTSISAIAGGVAGVIAGKLVYRYRPRTFILWGSVVSGVSSLLLSLSTSLWYFYIFSFIAGIAGGFSGAITTFTLLSKWFTRKWGTALGITQAGGAIGRIVISPLVGLIAENFGWQATYLFAGLLVLAIHVPLILFVLKDSPKPMGLLSDGDKPEEIASPTNGKLLIQTTTEPTNIAKNTGLFSFLKSPALWLMCISFAFIAIGYSVVATHEVSFMTDMKVSATLAASAFGFTLGIGAIASLASGWLADKLSSRYVAILFILVAVAGMLILLGADTMSKMWLFAVLFGLGIGASGTLLPIVTRDIFGAANFSVLFGFTNVLFVAGFAIGAPLAGFIFDATGSYHTVFVIVTAIYVGAILAIYFAFGAKPKPLVRLSVSKK